MKLLGNAAGRTEGRGGGGRTNGFLSQREAAAVDKTSPVLFGVRCFSLRAVARGREEDEGEDHTHLKDGVALQGIY